MGNSRFNHSLFHSLFNGVSGQRYIAFKSTAGPTADVHIRLFEQWVKFENKLDLGISGFDLPRIQESAKRTESAAAQVT